MKAVTTERVKELFTGLVEFRSINLVTGQLFMHVKKENVEKVKEILEKESIEGKYIDNLRSIPNTEIWYIQLTGETPEQNEG